MFSKPYPTRSGLIQPPPWKTCPAVVINIFYIPYLRYIYIKPPCKVSAPSLKNMDVTDLQTFAIICSQVISASNNKGNTEDFSDKRAVKI